MIKKFNEFGEINEERDNLFMRDGLKIMNVIEQSLIGKKVKLFASDYSDFESSYEYKDIGFQSDNDEKIVEIVSIKWIDFHGVPTVSTKDAIPTIVRNESGKEFELDLLLSEIIEQ